MQTLNQDIKEKTFKRVYLLFGDEPFLVNSYKKRLREAIAGDEIGHFEDSMALLKELDFPAEQVINFDVDRLGYVLRKH